MDMQNSHWVRTIIELCELWEKIEFYEIVNT